MFTGRGQMVTFVYSPTKQNAVTFTYKFNWHQTWSPNVILVECPMILCCHSLTSSKHYRLRTCNNLFYLESIDMLHPINMISCQKTHDKFLSLALKHKELLVDCQPFWIKAAILFLINMLYLSNHSLQLLRCRLHNRSAWSCDIAGQ